MAPIDPVAISALCISLVAFFFTAGQLLQQYFATADGYRRCQSSVMGPFWGSNTRLHWRWREFRFETIYYVPRLSIKRLSEISVNPDGTREILDVRSKKRLVASNMMYI